MGLVLAVFSALAIEIDPSFFDETPCTVADLAPYLSVTARDWCAVEHQTAQLYANNYSNNNELARAQKLLAIRCALLLDDHFPSAITGDARVMELFVLSWKNVYCAFQQAI